MSIRVRADILVMRELDTRLAGQNGRFERFWSRIACPRWAAEASGLHISRIEGGASNECQLSVKAAILSSDDLSQSLPLIGRVDADREQLASCPMSRSGALDGNLRIASEGDKLRPPLKPIAVLPVAAALGRDEEAEIVTKSYSSGIAHHLASHPRAGAGSGRL